MAHTINHGGGRVRTPYTLAAACVVLLSQPSCSAAQVPMGRAAASGSLARVARAVTPAVVSIESEFSTAARMQQDESGAVPPGMEVPPELLPPGARQRQEPARAGGTGFIVTSDGYILTNNHVVAGASRVTVTLLDRRIFFARVVGHDPSTDVALIKIDGSGYPTIPLGDDSTAQVGDGVLAVGNPLGLNFTVTSGIVSAKGRSGGLRSLFGSDFAVVDFIQTDAVINPGNSGGPLIDMSGRVIGINSAIESPTGVYAGYGFAIPISIAKIVMDQIRQYGHVRRAMIGVSLQDVTPADARAAGLQQIRGALVGGFSGPGSPARRAGIHPGDIILAVDGRVIDQTSDLQRLILAYRPGQTVTVTVMRFGTQRTSQVTLGEAPTVTEVTAASDRSGNRTPAGRLGIQVAPLTPDVAGQLRLAANIGGLAVASVDPSGPSYGLLFPRDVITAVFGPAGVQLAVSTVQDLEQAVAGAANGVASLLVVSPSSAAAGRSAVENTRVVNIALTR